MTRKFEVGTLVMLTAIVLQGAPYIPSLLPIPSVPAFPPIGTGGCAACANGGVCMCVRPDRMIRCDVSNMYGAGNI